MSIIQAPCNYLKHPSAPAAETTKSKNDEAITRSTEEKPTSFPAPDRVFIDRLNPNRLNMLINDQKLSIETRPESQGSGLQPHTNESTRSTRSVNDHAAASKSPINLYVVIHEDLQGEDRDKLFKDHFSWLKTELEEISGRDINISFLSTHEMRHTNYKHQDLDAAGHAFVETVEGLREKLGFAADKNKFLLLTKDAINEDTLGVGAYDYAIAKARTGVPAHEVGHMFGATHEDAERYFNSHGEVISSIYGEQRLLDKIRETPELGPLLGYQPSIMNGGDGIQQPQGQSFRFSNKNRENIRNYLSKIL